MKKEILPAVSAIIFNERREVLLQRRRDTGKWCIISGHVEFGETVEHAMLREIEEETSISGKIVRLIGVYSSPEYSTYTYHDRTVQYVVTYFEVQLSGEIPNGFSKTETEAFAWFSKDNIPSDLDMINPNWLVDAIDGHVDAFIR
jgi:8-oxo-dGTP pyrophosphatase MutT (NUDIX family)